MEAMAMLVAASAPLAGVPTWVWIVAEAVFVLGAIIVTRLWWRETRSSGRRSIRTVRLRAAMSGVVIVAAFVAARLAS